MSRKRVSTSNRVEAYVEAVLSGTLPSCRMVILACERYRADQKRDDIRMDWQAVNRVVAFAKILKHFKGEFAGRPITVTVRLSLRTRWQRL